MTDERELSFLYEAINEGLGSYGIAFQCNDGVPWFMAMSGIIFHIEDYIPVTYRFDKNPASSQSFRWSSATNGAVKFSAGEILDRAIHADLLRVRIDSEEVMRFDLVSARDELIEFKKRCEDW